MIMSGTQLLRTGVFYIVEMFECFEMIFLLMPSQQSDLSLAGEGRGQEVVGGGAERRRCVLTAPPGPVTAVHCCTALLDTVQPAVFSWSDCPT